MSKKYITAVFEYDDGCKLPLELTKAFTDDELFRGAKISAISLTDEITRIERLEEELECQP